MYNVDLYVKLCRINSMFRREEIHSKTYGETFKESLSVKIIIQGTSEGAFTLEKGYVIKKHCLKKLIWKVR